MQSNGVRVGARPADRLASGIAWAAAAGILAMVVCDQAFERMFCVLSYLVCIVYSIPFTLHTLKFAAAVFQNIVQRSHISYGHTPISAFLALIAVLGLPLKASIAAVLPRYVEANKIYDPRMVRAQALLYLGGIIIGAGIAGDLLPDTNQCVLLPLGDAAAAVLLGLVGWLYWRPVSGAPPGEDHSSLVDVGGLGEFDDGNTA